MNQLVATDFGLSADQLELVKSTVAKNATTDELKLFLYRCQQLGLDPLKPGQIFFVKYGSNPGTIVVGIEGFRARAQRTGRLSGIKRGVIRDDQGRCIGAWCEVKRRDWEDVAREEVSLAEYNTQKAMWLKMPETMIKKVAEAAALRMAFPDELGGVYSKDEMDQAARGNPDHRMAVTEAKDANSQIDPTDIAKGKRRVRDVSPLAAPGDFEIKFGSLKGSLIKDCTPHELEAFVESIMAESMKQGKDIRPDGPVAQALSNIEAYLTEVEATA